VNQSAGSSNLEQPTGNATYQIILKGIQPNTTHIEAKGKLATLFKTTTEQIDNLLATPDFVVKKGVSLDIATKYKSAIEAAGGVCDVAPEQVPVVALDIDLPTATPLEAPRSARPSLPSTNSGAESRPGATGGTDYMKPIVEGLAVLRHKISRNGAYLGVLIGFAAFAFSLFLSWASIPSGQMAIDGGTVSGWRELGYLAIFPLALALYPVFLQRPVGLRNLLINIAIAFGLLAYNNVAHRETWHNGYGNMGSTLDAGFWIGLIAMVAISVCGLAWSLHTSTDTGAQGGEL
jgi:hypothetical protein